MPEQEAGDLSIELLKNTNFNENKAWTFSDNVTYKAVAGNELMVNGDAETDLHAEPSYIDGDGDVIVPASTSGSTDGGYQVNWDRDITSVVDNRVNI